MSNDYRHTLTVLGLKDAPGQFASVLGKKIYRDETGYRWLPKQPGIEDLIERMRPRIEVDAPKFHFETTTGPDVEAVAKVSEKTRGVWFLLRYSSWESGYRGQAVIRDGKVIEHLHRVGYQGPAYLFADVTHPLVDLSAAYTEQTLALKARERLLDAVQIVRDLKETLEDPRFANSRFRALGDNRRVEQTHESLTAMLTAMMGYTSEISFEGVLVEEPPEKSGAPVDGDAPAPRARRSRNRRSGQRP